MFLYNFKFLCLNVLFVLKKNKKRLIVLSKFCYYKIETVYIAHCIKNKILFKTKHATFLCIKLVMLKAKLEVFF